MKSTTSLGGIDHAQAVGGGGVVGFIEILVDRLEQLLLFGVVGDFVGGPADGPVVGPQTVYRPPPHVAGEEGAFQLVQLAGHVVFPVELVLVKDPVEDVLGEDVLEQHLPHVGLGHVGADAPAAQGQELRCPGPVVGVALLGRRHRLPQVLQHRRQVRLELRLGLAELLDAGQFVVQEPAYEPVQFPGAGHVHPQRHVAVLHQHRRFRVLEHDVVPGIAPVELGPNLRVQVVVAVLGLPVAPGHAQGVLHRAVGDDVARRFQLGYEHQPFPVLAAVGVQAVLEGRADVQLVVRAAELHQFLAPGVVVRYVGV